VAAICITANPQAVSSTAPIVTGRMT
jgi:hypothetical protein